MNQRTEIAIFGGGCFWCTEAVFERLKGVISVMPGYAGGTSKDPTYKQVCSGETGHAEVVQIRYDPAQISYNALLSVFFATHDPTTLNRQGADAGSQYRSVIFCTTEDQKQEAEAFIRRLNNSDPKGNPVVTQVSSATTFYGAEDYHREYYRKNASAPYCRVVIDPKLAKFYKQFNALLN